MGKIIDLTNQKFGKLTVIRPTEERRNRQVVWECQCDCGKITYVVGQALRTGHTKSCGCLIQDNKDNNSLVGKQFGKLKVIKRDEKNLNRKIYWECECECGERFVVLGTDLRNNKISSCKNCREKMVKNDLTNQKFGMLTAISPTEKRTNGGHIIWKCKCDCGSYCEVNSNSLKTGNTSSCGCLNKKSLGEEKIKQWLNKNNIKYKYQITFENCRSPKNFPLIFDFVIYDNLNNIICIIEFDGIQHFKPIEYFGGKKYYDYLKICDEIKTRYCFDNQLELIRINYKQINEVESILNDNL